MPVRTPGTHRSVLQQGDGLIRIAGYCRNPGQARHRAWWGAPIGRTQACVTQLSIAVRSPCPDGTVLSERSRVPAAATGHDGMGDTRNLDRAGSVIDRSIAQLTPVVAAPSPYRAVLANRQRVPATCSNGSDVGKPGNLSCGRRNERPSETELPMGVRSPRDHRAIRAQRQPVVATQ